MPKPKEYYCFRCSGFKKGRPISIPVEPYNGAEEWCCYDCFPPEENGKMLVPCPKCMGKGHIKSKDLFRSGGRR